MNFPGHRSCSEHNSTERWSKKVNVFLTVELGSLKVTMKNGLCLSRTEDSLVYTNCFAVLQRSRAKDDQFCTLDPIVVS